MKKTIFTILLVLSLITSVYALVIPHAFYGTAKYSDNSSVPDGTVITAKLNGNAVDTSTVQDGKYGYGEDTLIVTDDLELGGIVTFHIGAVDSEQEITFQSGNATRLDLIFPGTAPAPETTPSEGNTTEDSTDTNTGTNQGGGESPGSNSGDTTGTGTNGGGSSGGGGGSSSSKKTIKPTLAPTPVDDESDGNDEEVSNLQEGTRFDNLNGLAGKSEENSPKNVLSNFLTGAVTGVFSNAAGKLGLIAGILIIALLNISLLYHLKRRKK